MSGKLNKLDKHGGDSYESDAYREEVYNDSRWPEVAKKYEIGFAANLYKASFVKEAAHSALTKLSSVLNAYYGMKNVMSKLPEGGTLTIEALNEVAATVSGDKPVPTGYLREALLTSRNDTTSAGQVGNYEKFTSDTMKADVESGELTIDDYNEAMKTARDMDNQNIDDVMNKDGNLREMMTMIYNGTFINGGRNKDEISKSHSLKNILSNVTKTDEMMLHQIGRMSGNEDLSKLSLDFDIINAHKENGNADYFDTSATAKLVKKTTDKRKGKGNFISRAWQGVKRWFSAHNVFRGKNSVKSDVERQERKMGRDHYENLGVGLSDREKAFAGANGDLPWLEGRAWNKMDKESDANGMLNVAGASGTTLRMLSAYKMLGASKQELLNFRLALIAWMVSGQDHSISEILEGSHNVGLKGYEDMSEAVNMYMTIDPLNREETREKFAPNKEFPHETLFKMLLTDHAKMRIANQEKLNAKVINSMEMKKDLEMYLSAANDFADKYNGRELELLDLFDKYGVKSVDKLMEVLDEKIYKKSFDYEDEKEYFEGIENAFKTAEQDLNRAMKGNDQALIASKQKSYDDAKKDFLDAQMKFGVIESEYNELLTHQDMASTFATRESTYRTLAERGYRYTGEVGTGENKVNMAYKFNIFPNKDLKGGDVNDTSDLNARQLATEVYTTGLSMHYMNTAQRYFNFVAKKKLLKGHHDNTLGNGHMRLQGETDESVLFSARIGRIASRLFYEQFDDMAEQKVQSDTAGDVLDEPKGESKKSSYVGTVFRADNDSKRYSGKNGETVFTDALTSTTKDANITNNYYHDGGIILKINLNGHGAWDISSVVTLEGNRLKQEVILPRDAAMQITKSKYKARLVNGDFISEDDVLTGKVDEPSGWDKAKRVDVVELSEIPNKHNLEAEKFSAKRAKRLAYRKKLEAKAAKRAGA